MNFLIVPCFVFLFYLSYLPVFYSPFLTIKEIIFLFLCIFSSLYLFYSKAFFSFSSLQKKFIFSVFCLLCVSSFFSSAPFLSFYTVCLFLGSFILFLGLSFFLSVDLALRKRYLAHTFFILSFIQIGIALIQYFGFQLDLLGSFGNSEFLGFFLSLSLFLSLLFPLNRFFLGCLWGLSVLVFVLSQNFSCLLFFYVFLSVFFLKKYFKFFALTSLIPLSLLSFIFFPSVTHAVLGRLFIWVCSAVLIFKHPLTGVGLSQFSSYFLEGAFFVFHSFPSLAHTFGSYSGNVNDAHTVFLQLGVELGILGVFLSIFLIFYLIRSSFRLDLLRQFMIYFIVFKACLTVTLFSLTTLVTLVFFALFILPDSFFKFSLSKQVSVYLVFPIVFGLCFFKIASDYFYSKGLHDLQSQTAPKIPDNFLLSYSLFPDHPLVSLDLARMAFLTGHSSLMKSYFSEAFRVNANIDTRAFYAEALFRTQNFSLAKKQYLFLHTALPEYLQFPLFLALIEFKLGNFELSKQYAFEVLLCKPRLSNPSHAEFRALAQSLLYRLQ